jgi:hypothetical protein
MVWLAALIGALGFAGCSSGGASTPGHFQYPCNTGTQQQLANPTPNQTGVSTTSGNITVVAFGNNNLLYTTYAQWIVTLTDNTGMPWTGGPLKLVSDPSGPHPYPSDFYYASNIPMLNAGRTYQVFLSEPSATCTPVSVGSFST